MGYYEGQRENPCPRCGGVVATLFISVTPMSFSQRCQGCGVSDFTEAEETYLAGNESRPSRAPQPFVVVPSPNVIHTMD